MEIKLPKTLRTLTNREGFSLVELMVVIAIIAILAIVGITIFSGTQRTARDSRRRADIESISKAMEQSFRNAPGTCPGGAVQNGGTYCALNGSMFAEGTVPADPQGGGITTYCVDGGTGAASTADPGAWTTACPGTYETATAGNPSTPANMTWYRVCAQLESTATRFCRTAQQQ